MILQPWPVDQAYIKPNYPQTKLIVGATHSDMMDKLSEWVSSQLL